MGNTIMKLWGEKINIDEHPENQRLQSEEWDSIARAIIATAEDAGILTVEEQNALNWAQKRKLG